MWFIEKVRSHSVRGPKPIGRYFLGFLIALAFLQWRCGENPLQPLLRGPNEVWIQATGFDPATLTVSLGTTVTWTNKDNIKHDVTSGLPGNVRSDFGPSPTLNANMTFDHTFTRRGTFNYFCLIHGSNHGTGSIVVQ